MLREQRQFTLPSIPRIPIEHRRRQADFAHFIDYCMPDLFYRWNKRYDDIADAFNADDLQTASLMLQYLPRGGGATTLKMAWCLWTVLRGRRKYLRLKLRTDHEAQRFMRTIHRQVLDNDRLYECYPEAIHPFRYCEGIVQRMRNLTMHGVPLRIAMNRRSIQFPSFPMWADCSEAKIEAVSHLASDRGLYVQTQKGMVRPEFIYD